MNNEIKDLIRNYCRDNYLDVVKVTNYVETLIEGKEKPLSYLTKVFENFDCKSFSIGKDIYKTQCHLLDMLHKHEFKGTTKERLMIEEIVVHSLLEFPITCEEMDKTLEAIIQYCDQRNEKTYGKFKGYLLKSKTLAKCNPPLVVIEKECERIADLIS